MNENIAVVILASAVFYGTPLLYAALGEVLTERSGVLNLGLEGMMLMGAVMGFWTVQYVGGPGWLVLCGAVLVAAAAGAATALIHAVLVISLRANQIVSGIALTIFAGVIGLSSYIGTRGGVGGAPLAHHFRPLNLFGLKDFPILGPILFDQHALVYLSWLLVLATTWYIYRTSLGLRLRSVGDAPETADAAGINVTKYRYLHTIAGGAFAGIGGSVFSLAIALNWLDGMTAGAGWIAIALVIFGFWRPIPVMVGAYFFGGLSGLAFVLQTRQVRLPPEMFASLPYLMTIVVLAVVSSGWARRRSTAPAALGTPYLRET
ncbi:MAG: ABC transporter permease [bacterium]|nr:ABC transporter permease [bacterium]MDE0289718.1 ABC transporter permease [bacterium]MDE0440173.1 ABC transporter permease [bacterium]